MKTGKKRILIIDDDNGINEAIKIILEEQGFSVDIYNQPDNVIERVIKLKPDLILLDLFILNVSGAEICKNLKNNDKTNMIPVIMLSASTQTKQISIEARADGFMFKPFDINELAEKIKLTFSRERI